MVGEEREGKVLTKDILISFPTLFFSCFLVLMILITILINSNNYNWSVLGVEKSDLPTKQRRRLKKGRTENKKNKK